MSPPTIATARAPDRRTLGPVIARVSRTLLAAPLMPWQRHVLDVACEIDPTTGRPAYGTVVVTVPRQSGKTTMTRGYAVGRALAIPQSSTWYTAQTRNAARGRFEDLIRAVRFGPLADHTTIRLTNGSESVEWPNGSRFRLFAPQPDAVHGETIDAAVIDEAWAFDDVRGAELMQAVVPAGSTRPWFQIWVVSTAGTEESTWLHQLVETGRTLPPTMAYFEWSAPSADLDDVIGAHPAVGRTISEAAVRAAHDVLPAGEFARAYGNLWTASSEAVIPPAVWAALQRADLPAPAGPPAAVAVDVSPDRSTATIAVAWATPAGPAVAVADHGPVTAALARAAADIAARFATPVVHDPKSAAAATADDLRRAGTPVRALSTADVAIASQQLYDAALAGAVTVRHDAALDAAVASASTRPVGDGWAWGRRKASGDITALCAATWALWALTHPPAEPFLLV